MPKSNMRRMGLFIAIAVFMAVVPPVVFGNQPQKGDRKGGDPWRNTIEDFQTLITGFFAIGAAYVTVRQMALSDRKSDERHYHLVRLNLRADKLRIERLLVPHFADLEATVAPFQLAVSDVKASRGDGWHQAIVDNSRLLQLIIPAIQRVFDRQVWTEYSDLYGGALSHAIKETQSEMRYLRQACDRAEQLHAAYNWKGEIKFGSDDPQEFDAALKHIESRAVIDKEFYAFAHQCDIVDGCLRGVIGELEGLGNFYGVNLHVRDLMFSPYE